ncbi:MAG: hypothetical protein GY766_05610 [Herbaspirillum sp.]|uniref:hypothetical protein n=1 Tax=Herbaspirillum sp. TaxID=1890675 RepID=UPI00258B052A|nr:hypothetical protein [Herbaspirillum sp.]MCP3654359.1 hypothetical protein [Herbaspirillum sp.]
MSDQAPERIWAEPGMPGYLDEVSPTYTVGYIRADLHAELMRAADSLAGAVAGHVSEDDCDYTMEMATKLDVALSAYKQAKEKLRL